MGRVQPCVHSPHHKNPEDAHHNLQHCQYQYRRKKPGKFPLGNKRQLEIFHKIGGTYRQYLGIQHIQIAQISDTETAQYFHKQNQH